jgi:hypothetical protein
MSSTCKVTEEFITIWNTYCHLLSVQSDKFVLIIHKLTQNSTLSIQEKKIWIELIELMADTIYTIKNCADKYKSKYGENYYRQTQKYDEPELNCCSNLLKILESDLFWDREDEYDIAFSKALLSDN